MGLLQRLGVTVGTVLLGLVVLAGESLAHGDGLWVKAATSPGRSGTTEVRVEVMTSQSQPAASVVNAYAADASVPAGKRQYYQLGKVGDGLFTGSLRFGEAGPMRVDVYVTTTDSEVHQALVPLDIANPVFFEGVPELPPIMTGSPGAGPSLWLWAITGWLLAAGALGVVVWRRDRSQNRHTA